VDHRKYQAEVSRGQALPTKNKLVAYFLLVTVGLPEGGTEESAGQVAEDTLPDSTGSDAGVFGNVSRTA
jgi:hypothetical protein